MDPVSSTTDAVSFRDRVFGIHSGRRRWYPDGMAAADPSIPERRRSTSRLPLWICLATTVVVVHTCVQIEWWNYRAGGILPKDTRGPGNPKWREAAARSIRANFQHRIKMQEYDRIIAERGRVTAAEEVALETNPRPLTVTEQNELQRELDQRHTNSTLLSWVQTGGLAQYVLAPFAFVVSLVLLIRAATWRGRLGCGLLGVLSGGAIGAMLYRGYFTSLGW